ncbi:unnamed protein product, partial [Discosporangium mesarthrocarpum]
LRNISTLTRGLKILPPATAFFSIAKVIFPLSQGEGEAGTETGKGDLAPGMGARVLVDFLPDSLGDYEDALTVATQAGSFKV